MKIKAILLSLAILFCYSLPAAADNGGAAHETASTSSQQESDKSQPSSPQGNSAGQKDKSGDAQASQTMPGWSAGVLIVLSYVFVLVGVSRVISQLMAAPTSTTGDGKTWTWSLAQALSEEVEFNTTDATGAKKTETLLVASTSRVIALFGLIALLVLFMGFGAIAMWYFATSAKMPDFSGILNYFYAGAGLFVPYGLNQFKEAFTAFSPKSAKG